MVLETLDVVKRVQCEKPLGLNSKEANPRLHEGFCVQQVSDAIIKSHEQGTWASIS